MNSRHEGLQTEGSYLWTCLQPVQLKRAALYFDALAAMGGPPPAGALLGAHLKLVKEFVSATLKTSADSSREKGRRFSIRARKP